MLINHVNIAHIRREYQFEKLNRSNLTPHPIPMFEKWLNQAYLACIPDPNAMCLATVDHFGQPYQRLVLLKNFSYETMIFYTNLHSRKSIHLIHNSQISLFFSWNIIDRQVIIIGNAYQLSQKDTNKYFYTRPKNNQISTLISQQSKIISSKKTLESQFLKFKKKYFQKKIPLPDFWGGYKVYIKSIEFWQGGKYRLHDRFIYTRHHNKWNIDRLSP